MPGQQPSVTDSEGRQFACFPVAVLVFIIDEDERILFLSHPEQRDAWQIVKGALEAGETVLEGALRETREEVGPDVQVRPLGTVHALTAQDSDARAIALFYLMAYEGGQIQPGDDMQGSQFRWWNVEELEAENIEVVVPSEKWIVERAVELYRLWKEQNKGVM